MKKTVFILALFVFLVTTWAGITFVVGNKAELHYRYLIDESAQLGFVNISNTRYERGFLTSTAETLLELNLPAMPVDEAELPDGEAPQESEPQTVQLLFEHTLHHGPLPFSSGPAERYGTGPAIALIETRLTRFSPDPEGLENLLEEIPELKETVSIARIRLDGTTDSLLEVPPFEYPMAEARLATRGLRVEAVYSISDGSLSGVYDLQSVEFAAPDGGTMTWKGFTGEFDLERVLPMLYVGPSKARVGAMELSFPQPDAEEQKAIVMEEMLLSSNSSYDGEVVNIEQLTTFNGVFVDGEKYGPLVIDAEVRNLDAQALSGFQQQVVDIYKQADTLDPDALAGMVLPMYLDLFGKLVSSGPEMNIRRFSLDTPKGMAEGDFRIKINAGESLSPEAPLAFFQYLQKIESSANLSLDEELVRTLMLEKMKQVARGQAEVARFMNPDAAHTDEDIDRLAEEQLNQQLGMYIAQKFIIREGGKLKSNMSFKQGELLVNGQPFPLFRAM